MKQIDYEELRIGQVFTHCPYYADDANFTRYLWIVTADGRGENLKDHMIDGMVGENTHIGESNIHILEEEDLIRLNLKDIVDNIKITLL